MDDDTGYDLDDPKHPSFYERAVWAWDNRDKSQPFACVPDESAGLADEEQSAA